MGLKYVFISFLLPILLWLFPAKSSFGSDCIKAQKLSEEAADHLLHDLNLAEKQFRNAINLCKKSAALRYNHALALYKQGRYKESEDKIEEAISLNPTYAKALNALAFLIISQEDGDRSRALELAERAVKLDPGNKEYHDTLVKARVPHFPPDLNMEFEFEDENNNRILEAAEPAVLKVTVKNTGKGSAHTVKIIPEPEHSLPGLSIDQGITIPTIEPFSAKTVEFMVRTEEEHLPTSTISILINASEANGFDADPLKIVISTKAAAPPMLKVVVIGLDDHNENGQIEPAEIVEITARIQNTGSGNAYGVRARVNLGENVFPAGTTRTDFELGDIPSGQFKDLVFSIYTAKRATGIPVSISISEQRQKHYKKHPLDLAFNKQEKQKPKELIVATAETIYSDIAISATPSLSVDIDTPIKTNRSLPNAIAVVIGNKLYKDKFIPDVQYAIRDAAVMKQYLIDTFGYKEHNITYMQNAELTDFRKTFGDETDHRGSLYNRTRKGEADVFVYYSGHGVPDTNTKKAYLMPSGSDPNSIRLTGYALDTLYKNLSRLYGDKKVRSLTIVLESCFSGQYNNGFIIHNASPIFLESRMPVLTNDNAVVFTSSQGDQISSWYPEKRHGLFTYFFLKAIRDAAQDGRKMSAGDIETTLLDGDSVKDYAWRLYQRDQEPVVMGNKKLLLVNDD